VYVLFEEIARRVFLITLFFVCCHNSWCGSGIGAGVGLGFRLIGGLSLLEVASCGERVAARESGQRMGVLAGTG
jgi:hypothetical protein